MKKRVFSVIEGIVQKTRNMLVKQGVFKIKGIKKGVTIPRKTKNGATLFISHVPNFAMGTCKAF